MAALHSKRATGMKSYQAASATALDLQAFRASAGVRKASLVPEPDVALLICSAALLIAMQRRQSRWVVTIGDHAGGRRIPVGRESAGS